MITFNLTGPTPAEFDFEVAVKTYGGGSYNIGHGLLLDQETNTISVNTVDGLENEDNTLPIAKSAFRRRFWTNGRQRQTGRPMPIKLWGCNAAALRL